MVITSDVLGAISAFSFGSPEIIPEFECCIVFCFVYSVVQTIRQCSVFRVILFLFFTCSIVDYWYIYYWYIFYLQVKQLVSRVIYIMFRLILIYFYNLFSKADDTEGIQIFQKVKNRELHCKLKKQILKRRTMRQCPMPLINTVIHKYQFLIKQLRQFYEYYK